MDMEEECVDEVGKFLDEYNPSKANELQDLFEDCVYSEIKFYSQSVCPRKVSTERKISTNQEFWFLI